MIQESIQGGRSVTYRGAASDRDLHQILALQALNVEEHLSADEVRDQGFVTVHHDFGLLASMNESGPHAVACDGDQVVGYALVMVPAFESRIPVLGAMFERLRTLRHRGRPVIEWDYFVMGQVCVARSHRGQGVFDGLYAELRRLHGHRFDATITEIARRNTRSIRAHRRVGFELLERYREPGAEDWDIVIWDWT